MEWFSPEVRLILSTWNPFTLQTLIQRRQILHPLDGRNGCITSLFSTILQILRVSYIFINLPPCCFGFPVPCFRLFLILSLIVESLTTQTHRKLFLHVIAPPIKTSKEALSVALFQSDYEVVAAFVLVLRERRVHGTVRK